MPLDASIYNNIQNPKPDSPVNALLGISQLQQAQSQNKLADFALQDKQRQVSGDNALANLISQGGDSTAVAKGLAEQGYGQQSIAYTKQAAELAKQQREAATAQIEQHLKNFEVAGRIMNGVKDQESWDRARQQTAEIFGPEKAAQLPAQYDPRLIEENRMKALTVQQQLEQKWQEMKYTTPDANTVANNNTSRQNNQETNSTSRANNSATVGATIRGQNLTDARAKDQLQQGKTPPGYRMNSDGSMTAITGGPADIKNNKETAQKSQDAQDVINILNQADPLIDKATQGRVGNAVDQTAAMFGKSLPGAQATAQLKALEGALVSKMPKMSGPQSDKDVLLYKQMAGQIGDPDIPAQTKRAAMKTIRNLNEKYLGLTPDSTAPKTQKDVFSAADAILQGK